MAEPFNVSPERINGKPTPWGKFAQHRRDSRGRDIEFLLSFEEWWSIWQQSGKWRKRGCKIGQFVMARFGDKGPYAVGNVVIMSCGQNHHDANIGRPSPKTKAWARQHSKIMTGRKHTKEHNRKIGVASKRVWAERKQQNA